MLHLEFGVGCGEGDSRNELCLSARGADGRRINHVDGKSDRTLFPNEIWDERVGRLQAGQQVAETCTYAKFLLEKLHAPRLIAVLIDHELLMDLGTVADQLESDRGAEAPGATVIYFNRSRDSKNRDLALSAGAESSLEGDEADGEAKTNENQIKLAAAKESAEPECCEENQKAKHPGDGRELSSQHHALPRVLDLTKDQSQELLFGGCVHCLPVEPGVMPERGHKSTCSRPLA
jgi:hypothetical protein